MNRAQFLGAILSPLLLLFKKKDVAPKPSAWGIKIARAVWEDHKKRPYRDSFGYITGLADPVNPGQIYIYRQWDNGICEYIKKESL